MTREEFDRLVRQAIDGLPPELIRQIANVAISAVTMTKSALRFGGRCATRLLDIFFGVDESPHNPST